MAKINFYVGTYTEKIQVDYENVKNSDGIYYLSFDTNTKKIKIISKNNNIENPTFILKNNNTLYAVGEVKNKATISSFNISKNHELVFKNSIAIKGSGACHLSTNGKYVFCSNYGSGNIVGSKILNDGSLYKATINVSHEQFGRNKKISRVHSSIFSKDNKFLYVADLGLDRIYNYSVSKDSLVSNEKQAFVITDEHQGPRHMAITNDGKTLYMVSEYGNILFVYDVNTDDGTLEEKYKVEISQEITRQLSYASEIKITADGKFLYIALRGKNTISIFDIANEKLPVQISEHTTYGDWPRHFDITDHVEYIIIANQNDNNITVCSIDNNIGEITRKLASINIPSPSCITIESTL